MRSSWIVVLAVLLVSALGAQAFTSPTEEQINAAAENPAKIKDLLAGATVAQASSVLLGVVWAVEQAPMAWADKKEQIGLLFAQVQEAMGDDAMIVINDVARRINPELLPEVAAPGAATVAPPSLPIALPLAPPIAPTYEGQ